MNWWPEVSKYIEGTLVWHDEAPGTRVASPAGVMRGETVVLISCASSIHFSCTFHIQPPTTERLKQANIKQGCRVTVILVTIVVNNIIPKGQAMPVLRCRRDMGRRSRDQQISHHYLGL